MEGSSEYDKLIFSLTQEVIDDIGRDIENKVVGVGRNSQNLDEIMEDKEKKRKKKIEH